MKHYFETITSSIFLDQHSVNLNFSEENSLLNLLSLYISFTDYCLFLIIFLIIRFFGWRAILFIYILGIFIQVWLSYSFIYKPTISTKLIIPYTEEIKSLLSLLVFPFGNTLRLVLTQVGGIRLAVGGLFSTSYSNSKLNVLSFKEFGETYLEKQDISLNKALFNEYATAYENGQYSVCAHLFRETDIINGKLLLRLSKQHFFAIGRKDPDTLTDLNPDKLNEYRYFLAETKKILLDKCETMYNVKFNIPERNFIDLNSCDSSQKEMTTPIDIAIATSREFNKVQEYMDGAALTNTIYGSEYKTFIYNIAERGTKTDVYTLLVPPQKKYLFKLVESKSRYNYPELYNIIRDNKLEIIIKGMDVHRKIKITSEEEIIHTLEKEKVITFFKDLTKVPQKEHYLGVIFNNRIPLATKNRIDKAMNEIIQREYIQDIKVIFKSISDPFI